MHNIWHSYWRESTYLFSVEMISRLTRVARSSFFSAIYMTMIYKVLIG